MKRTGTIAWGTLALIVPGGCLVGTVIGAAALWSAMETGVADLDRPAIRGNALLALAATFKLSISRAVARGFMAILHNEGAYTPQADGTYQLGDTDKEGGPSVGPGQVMAGLHLTHLADPLALAKVGNELRALYYAAAVYREAYDSAGGDIQAACRIYNGSGPDAAAYAQKAADFADTTWGGFDA